MSDESRVRQFRLFGEDDPGWFVWGLALFGLAGFVATAQLSLTLLKNEYIPQFFARFAASEGNQGQSRPILPSDTNILVNPGPMEYREPLGPMPDLLTELHLPPPIPEASALEENLEESFEPASERDQGVALDVALRSQPSSGGGLESGGETLVSEPTPVSDGGAEKATIVAASSDRADSRSVDCAPVLLVTFSSGGVEPVEYDLASKVKRLADWLSRHPAAKVYLEGHTDGVGHEEFNLVLSHRRARAVGDLLMKAGVPAAQLSTRAYGESMLADPQPRSGRNRRVSMQTMNGNDCLPAAEDKEG